MSPEMTVEHLTFVWLLVILHYGGLSPIILQMLRASKSRILNKRRINECFVLPTFYGH